MWCRVEQAPAVDVCPIAYLTVLAHHQTTRRRGDSPPVTLFCISISHLCDNVPFYAQQLGEDPLACLLSSVLTPAV